MIKDVVNAMSWIIDVNIVLFNEFQDLATTFKGKLIYFFIKSALQICNTL